MITFKNMIEVKYGWKKKKSYLKKRR